MGGFRVGKLRKFSHSRNTGEKLREGQVSDNDVQTVIMSMAVLLGQFIAY